MTRTLRSCLALVAAFAGCDRSGADMIPSVLVPDNPLVAAVPMATPSMDMGGVGGVPVPSLAETPEPRASGDGFTVILPPGWELKSDPQTFGAARGTTATIRIKLPSNERSGAELSAAARDRALCDGYFHTLATSLQIDPFTSTASAGCEREGGLAGMLLIGMIETRDERPYLLMCGGVETDRNTWESECRAIGASLRWDGAAKLATMIETTAKSDPTGDGGKRVLANGVAVTLVPGWKIVPGQSNVALAATRESGLGVFSYGLVDAPLAIASSAECRQTAVTGDFGGKVTAIEFDDGRCTFVMDAGATLTDMVLAPGPHKNALWIACVRSARDASTADECKAMIASVTFTTRRARLDSRTGGG